MFTVSSFPHRGHLKLISRRPGRIGATFAAIGQAKHCGHALNKASAGTTAFLPGAALCF